jgi:cytoskeleton protein RodZ
MKKIGDILRERREEKKLTLGQVQAQTHISSKYVLGLENGIMSEFPGEVYYLGFLRRYAKFLGLDDDDLIQVFRRETLNQQVENQSYASSQKKSIDWSRVFVGVIVLGLMVVLAGFLLWIKDHGRELPKNSYENSGIAAVQDDSLNMEEKAGSVSEPKKNVSDSKPVTAGLKESLGVITGQKPVSEKPLVLRLKANGDCWVKVMADGKLLYEKVLMAGADTQVTANEKLYISIGYVPALEVYLNDMPVDIKKGSKQDVNDLTLTLRELEELKKKQ